MSARSIAVIVVFSASVALSTVSPGATENSSDSPVVTVSSSGNHGGSSVAHSAVGSGPAGVTSGPAIRPGTTQASVGAQRPMPAINNPRPYLAGSKLGQLPPTIRLPIQPGVSRGSYSVRPPLSNSSSPGEESQPRISPHRAVPSQKGSTTMFSQHATGDSIRVTGRATTPQTGAFSTGKHRIVCATGRAGSLTSRRPVIVMTITTTITTTAIGGVTIATPSFWSTGVFGVGPMAGGILPGAMIPTTPLTNMTVPSTATTDCYPTRLWPTSKANCKDLVISPMRSMEFSDP